MLRFNRKAKTQSSKPSTKRTYATKKTNKKSLPQTKSIRMISTISSSSSPQFRSISPTNIFKQTTLPFLSLSSTCSPKPCTSAPNLMFPRRSFTLHTISPNTIPLHKSILKTNQTQPLIIPTIRPFSSNDKVQDDDHDHGAFERKPPSDPSQALKITIVDREGVEHLVDCKIGDNVLQLMRIFQEKDPKLYLEGACESSLACSTCHIILDEKSYNALQQLKEATEQEDDLLDMASCLSPTSRLGCQINLIKEMDGGKISLPKFSRNFYVDGHVPEPH